MDGLCYERTETIKLPRLVERDISMDKIHEVNYELNALPWDPPLKKRMPIQKPGRSKQDYGTPPELLAAIKRRLGIGQFDIDLAASAENAVCVNYYDEAMDALADRNPWKVTQGGWAFCNPPYSHIEPWVTKAVREADAGAHIAMLLPASTGSNWWAAWVEGYAYTLFLNGRVTFVGCSAPYPKDSALILYTPQFFLGHEIWFWENENL